MEENTGIFEKLTENLEEYGKTSIELIKLKALDKTTDLVSTLIPRFIAFYALSFFLLLFSIAIALWIGESMGKIWDGFFIVSGFYFITGIILYFFLHKWLKRLTGDFIIRESLK